MIIKFESLEEFDSALSNLTILYDPKRKILYTLVAGAIVLYKPKSDEEVKKLKSWRTVRTARLIPTAIPDTIDSFIKAAEELRREASKIMGKKLKDVRMGDNGIDLVFEDGTTLEIYCFGEWGLFIDEEDQDQEDENLL